jgi:hypothetical protein
LSCTILLQTHFYDATIAAAYRRLKREAPPGAEIVVALNCGAAPERVPDAAASLPPGALFLCGNESLLSLPYPVKCAPEGWRLNPGNTDLIALLFLARHPECAQLWAIEYDVHYEGDWGRFFAHFAASPADLLTTTIYRQRETPRKELAPPFRSPAFASYPEGERLRAFLPIFRLGRRGFAAIDAAYRAGAGGHYELTWPTILHHAGLTLEDIGGDGAWVRPENVDRFYFNTKASFSMQPGTFVFRPGFTRVIRRPDTLWHPVKPAGVGPWDKASRAGLRGPRRLLERLKPAVNRVLVRRWLATRWNPLRPPGPGAPEGGAAR